MLGILNIIWFLYFGVLVLTRRVLTFVNCVAFTFVHYILNMKKFILFFLSVSLVAGLSAQQLDSVPVPKVKKDIPNLANRANDHLVFQVGYTGWAGIPDTITTSGFSKSVNIYLMYDFPFKNNPKLSMAFGPGFGSDHILFPRLM